LRTYNADAAADSWQRVLAFFEEHVEGTSPPPSFES
jgi:dienelactone hydrolase